jgi:outer membrane protein
MEELKKYPASLLNQFNMLRVVTIIFSVLFSFQVKSQTVYSLQQCIDSALANNISVRQTDLVMQANQVNLSQSRSNKLPSLSGNIYHGIAQGRSIDRSSNSYVTQTQDFADYSVTSGATVFNGGRLQNSVKQNVYGYEASRMELQQAKDNLVLDVILAYMLVLNNEELTQSAMNQAAVSQSEVDRLTVLNNQGAIQPAQLSDLKGQLMNDQLTILDAKNNVETAKLALLQLMNKRYDGAIEVEKMNVRDYLSAYSKTAADVYQNALQQFAQIKAVELRKKSF